MEVKKGYKQTEVGIIPEDWQVTTLAKVCQMKSGDSITSAGIDEFSKYPCYGGNGLRGFTSRFTHDGKYALIGRQGALCGNVLGVEGKFFASEHAIVVTASAKTDIRWLTYVLGEMRLNQYSESSAQPGLSVSKILSLDLPFPPTLAEQEAIAEALSDADALIEAIEQLIAKKRQIKQGAMSELLTGKRRLSEFNDEWKTTKLGEFAKINKGQLITEKTVTSGNIPVIAGGKEPAYYHNKPNRKGKTITISASGANAGYVAFYDKPIFASDCSTIEEDFNYSIDFIYQFLLLNQQKIYNAQTGGAQPHIHAKDLKPLEIIIPSKDEQTAIAEILSDMDAEISALEAKLSKARQVKAGMMSELLTGKIRLV